MGPIAFAFYSSVFRESEGLVERWCSSCTRRRVVLDEARSGRKVVGMVFIPFSDIFSQELPSSFTLIQWNRLVGAVFQFKGIVLRCRSRYTKRVLYSLDDLPQMHQDMHYKWSPFPIQKKKHHQDLKIQLQAAPGKYHLSESIDVSTSRGICVCVLAFCNPPL